MKLIEEHEVFATFVGTRLDTQKLNNLAIVSKNSAEGYSDCEEYCIGNLAELDEDFLQKFRITVALRKRWEKAGVLFRVLLYLCNGTLVGGHVFKYRKSDCLTGYAVAPTQQEIRIVERILKHLTEEKM